MPEEYDFNDDSFYQGQRPLRYSEGDPLCGRARLGGAYRESPRQLETALALAQTNFVIEHNGKPVASIKTGFRAAVRRAGIEYCSPHALKHTAATWMMKDGIDLEKVARYLGTTKNVVERVYGHHAPDYLADASKALEL